MTKMKSYRLDPWALQMLEDLKAIMKGTTEKEIIQAGIWSTWEANTKKTINGWQLQELSQKWTEHH